MTVLQGTTQDGQLVPVQVDAQGRLVAEGLPGPPGPPGPEGGSNWLSDGTNVYRLSGNVGIGTASPNAILEVGGSSTGEIEIARFRIEGQTNNPMLRVFSDEANKLLTIGTAGSVTGTQLSFRIGNTEQARIDSSGRLLVGTSSAPPSSPAGSVAAKGGAYLQSPDGSWWRVTVNDAGVLTTTKAPVAKAAGEDRADRSKLISEGDSNEIR